MLVLSAGTAGDAATWYQSKNYRSRVVFEPRAVLKEFGTVLSDQHYRAGARFNADMRYVVIPMRPAGTDNWSEERLAGISRGTRW